jgi:hypothetical protein
VNNEVHLGQSAITTASTNFDQGSSPRRQLSYSACKQIERFILVPILKEPKLKPFHPLVRSIPTRIVNKQIVCLRDLEKILLWLAPVSLLYSPIVRLLLPLWFCLSGSASLLLPSGPSLPLLLFPPS